MEKIELKADLVLNVGDSDLIRVPINDMRKILDLGIVALFPEIIQKQEDDQKPKNLLMVGGGSEK